MFGMDGQTDTSSPLLDGQTEGLMALPVHFVTIGDHMRHHSYSLPKKMNFPKFADGRTDGRTEKKSDS